MRLQRITRASHNTFRQIQEKELEPVKILLAESHAAARQGLSLILRRLGGNTVIIEAADCDAALRIAGQQADVDLVLLDTAMPGMEGPQGIERVRAYLPSTPIVMLSASEDPQTVRDALSCGAQGFIPKSTTGTLMLGALQLVFSGGVYLPSFLLDLPKLPSNDTPFNPNAGDGSGLTRRQREVLALIIKGHPNKEIARALNISVTTVRTHATAIFKTLHVTNRTQAGHVAAQRGFSLSN